MNVPPHGGSASLDARRCVTTGASLHVVMDLNRYFMPVVARNPNHQRCQLLFEPRAERIKKIK